MTFTRKTLPAQPYLYIEKTCPYPEIGAAMGAAFGAVFGFVQAKGITPLSMPLSVYWTMGSDSVTFHGSVLVSEADAQKAEADVRAGLLPAGDAMFGLHEGDYSGLGATHQALWKHLEDADIAPAMPVWEIYLNDPAQVAPEALKTEIYRFIG